MLLHIYWCLIADNIKIIIVQIKLLVYCLEEGLMDDEYWSSNGPQIEQDDPDWISDSKSTPKKSKKLKGSKYKKGEKKSSMVREREFKCNQCDQSEPFQTRTELKEHLNEIHNGAGLEDITYKCIEGECSFETMSQKSLNDHKQEVHGIAQSFKCKVIKNIFHYSNVSRGKHTKSFI